MTTEAVTETTAPVTTEPTQHTEPEQPHEAGDIDGDGIVSIDDAMKVLTYYTESFIGLEPNLSDAEREAADVDGDGRITLRDAQYILVYYVVNTIAHLNIPWSTITGKS